MLVFNFSHTDYSLLLKDFADLLQLPFDNNMVELQPPVGKGWYKCFKLFDELQVLLIYATLHQPLMQTRQKDTNDYFVLHFDDVFITDPVKVLIENEALTKRNTRHAAARLTCNMFTNTEILPAGLQVQSVKVLFNKQWLKKYMGLNNKDSVLQKYLSLKTENCDMEPLDAEYRKLLNEIWEGDTTQPLPLFHLQNRTTLLIERFFTRLMQKAGLLEGKFTLSPAEIEKLVRVKTTLLKDLSEPPPTIEAFSKIASMSPTNLKKKFKELFGDSIYAYYQKVRLEKARELLYNTTNIKQVAEAIGYHNTSNFTRAFKKQFHVAPEDALK